jgi:transposase-like protein
MVRKIVKMFPEVEPAEKEIKAESTYLSNFNMFGKCILIMFLIASGLNYEVLTILFGVSKASIHNWFHTLTGMKALMLKSIVRWSGVISIDEKWIKINGKWHYILSVVDNVTGFPLFFTLVTNLKAETWEIFFRRFYQLYGKPDLIISDGSNSLAKARKIVFPSVSFQLCKFHKLKNSTRWNKFSTTG